ncbi:flippase [Billgrantia azerbaijanica]|nr:flippase [Halomonas azerbaijanica]
MNLHSPLVRSFLTVGAIRILAIPLGLVTSIVLARYLGPEAFGRYAFVMALLPLLSLPVAGGLVQLLTREAAGYLYEGQWSSLRGLSRAACAWVILVSLVLSAAYLMADAVVGFPSEGKWALLGLLVPLIPLSGLTSVTKGLVKGLGRPSLAEFPSQIIKPLSVLVGLGGLLLWHELTPSSAILVQVGSGALVLAVSTLILARVMPPQAHQQSATYFPMFWVGSLLPFTMMIAAGTLNAHIGIVLLGFLGADEGVAALRVGERAAQFVVMSLVLVNMVIAPHLVRAYRAGDLAKLQRLFRQSARGAFLIASVVSLVLLLFGRPLIALSFGEAYASIAYSPMLVLVAGQLINVFFGSVGTILNMSGFERYTLMGQMCALMVNVLTCLYLIPQYGALGAATGASVGLVTWNLLLGIMMIRHLKIRPTVL